MEPDYISKVGVFPIPYMYLFFCILFFFFTCLLYSFFDKYFIVFFSFSFTDAT